MCKDNIIEPIEARILLADGLLDPAFGSSGIATADFGQVVRFVEWKRLDNGKLEAVGLTDAERKIAVARFNANGSLDNTFDGDGKKIIALPSAYADKLPNQFRIDASTGAFVASRDGDSPFIFLFTPKGDLNKQFDLDGVWAPSNAGANVTAAAITTDGRIFAAVDQQVDQQGGHQVVALRPDGSIDTSYAENSYASDVYDLVAAPNGGLLVYSTITTTGPDGEPTDLSGTFISVHLLDTNGDRPPSFRNGSTAYGANDYFNTSLVGVRVFADGAVSLVVAHFSPFSDHFRNYSVQHYSASGKQTEYYLDYALGYDTLQADAFTATFDDHGRVILLSDHPSSEGLRLLRFNTDGTLDTTFGVAGKSALGPVSRGRNGILQTVGDVIYLGFPKSDWSTFATARFGTGLPDDALGKARLDRKTLRITGTSTSDTIHVWVSSKNTSKIAVAIGTRSFSFSRKSVNQIRAYGMGGDDIIAEFGNITNVYFDGGQGDDTLISTDGNDTLVGNYGSDSLQSGKGNDLLFGRWSSNLPDVSEFDRGESNTILGGDGNDSILDFTYGTYGGGRGNDSIMVRFGRIDPGPGSDQMKISRGDFPSQIELYYFYRTQPVTIALDGLPIGEAGESDTIDAPADTTFALFGGRGSDTFHAANGKPDSIFGGDGMDEAFVDDQDALTDVETKH